MSLERRCSRLQIPNTGLWVSYCNCWLLFSILLNKQNPRCLPLFSNCHRLPMSKCGSRVCYWCSYHILTCSEINCWTDQQQQGTFYSDLIKIIIIELSVYVEKLYFRENQTTINLGSLSTCVFETRTATEREYFVCEDRSVSQISMLLISNGEKIVSNVNVVVWEQVKSENSSLPVAVRVSKTRVLKLFICSVVTYACLVAISGLLSEVNLNNFVASLIRRVIS